MKQHYILPLSAAALFVCFLLVSCAHVETIQPCLAGRQYGFWYGLLHGFITPVSFITSLFRDDVAIYAVNNSGGWYDFGFLLGAGGWGFLGGHKSKKREK
jgi:hypothetical protein